MIVLDEQLKDQYLIDAIAVWYPGSVTRLQMLRPATVIKDDNVPALLLTIQKPTFITINVTDFWRKIQAHAGYCIIAIDLIQGEVDDLPDLLRRLLAFPLLKTRTLRMGMVIRVQENSIRYYKYDRQIDEIPWRLISAD